MIGAFKSRTRVDLAGLAGNLIRSLADCKRALEEVERCGGVELEIASGDLEGDFAMLEMLRDAVRLVRDTGPAAVVEFSDFFCLAKVSPRDHRQDQVATWCAAAFGTDHASSPEQRGVRFLEEAIELYQAVDGKREMAHQLVDYIFDRPPGTPAQELGGVGVTVVALANALGLSADACEAEEVARVLAKPLEHFAARNKVKNDAGFNVTGAQ